MSSASNYLENKILDHFLKGTAYSQPSNIYLALSTANPTEDGSGLAEPSGNNYSRITANTWDAASGGATANSGALTFPTASGSWGTITHFAMFDASSGGNMLFYGALTASKAVGSGDALSFAAGDIDITCA